MEEIYHEGGVAVSANFSRRWAPEIAQAASLGLISTLQGDGSFGRIWRLTLKGHQWLETAE